MKMSVADLDKVVLCYKVSYVREGNYHWTLSLCRDLESEALLSPSWGVQ